MKFWWEKTQSHNLKPKLYDLTEDEDAGILPNTETGECKTHSLMKGLCLGHVSLNATFLLESKHEQVNNSQ